MDQVEITIVGGRAVLSWHQNQRVAQTIEFNDLVAGRTADELRRIADELTALPRNAHAVVTTDHGQCRVCWRDVPMTAAAASRQLAGSIAETETYWGR